MAYTPHSHEGLGPAIFWGGLATGACYVGGFALLAIAEGWAESFLLILVAGLVGWLIGTLAVALCMVLVGLPVSALFRWLDCEDPPVYALAGAVCGFLLPCLPVLVTVEGAGVEDNLFFAIPGMVAGGTAGFVWGRWRERIACEAEAEQQQPAAYDRNERWLR